MLPVDGGAALLMEFLGSSCVSACCSDLSRVMVSLSSPRHSRSLTLGTTRNLGAGHQLAKLAMSSVEPLHIKALPKANWHSAFMNNTLYICNEK
jgi:hypothetical protein